MGKINVDFICGPHPLFKEVINYPPKDVKYNVKIIPNNTYNNVFSRKIKGIITKIQSIFMVPRMMHSGGNSDIIHSTRGVLITNKKPWVVDIEMASSFTGLNWKNMKNPFTRWIITKYLSSPYCKKILPYSNAAKKNLIEWIDCSKFKDKLEVVHAAYHTTKVKRKYSDKVTISFICRTSPIELDFYTKGGHDLLKALGIIEDMIISRASVKLGTLQTSNPSSVTLGRFITASQQCIKYPATLNWKVDSKTFYAFKPVSDLHIMLTALSSPSTVAATSGLFHLKDHYFSKDGQAF